MNILLRMLTGACVAVLLCTGAASYGMQSTGYTIEPSGQNSGGGSRTSAGYTVVTDTVGQPVSGGSLSSENYGISGGLTPIMSDIETDPPSSVITDPQDGATIVVTSYIISGTADDGTGSGVVKVEVSTNCGLTWHTAIGTTSWSYIWEIGSPGAHNIRSRATDNDGNVETPGAGISVTVNAVDSPELQHYNWNPKLTGGDCAVCHSTPSTFLSADFREKPVFCRSCHNATAIAHDRNLMTMKGHSIMVNVTSGNAKMPTYGNITSAEYDNRPYAHLLFGDRVVCVTCHNPMQKSEDMGRVWEYTTTSDRLTYTLVNNGWSGYGSIAPRVYRDSSLWGAGGPTYSKSKKSYLVDPSEYTYDGLAGTVTFGAQQASTAYIYVTLDYPYLRVSNADNTLCADCHTEATHQPSGYDINCLACHVTHNTDNLADIRETVRTPDRAELPVVFEKYSGTGSFADGDTIYDGICEVCHTSTLYHKRDGSGTGHNNGTDCTTCHSHASGFAK